VGHPKAVAFPRRKPPFHPEDPLHPRPVGGLGEGEEDPSAQDEEEAQEEGKAEEGKAKKPQGPEGVEEGEGS
jgi:hypothetical protein